MKLKTSLLALAACGLGTAAIAQNFEETQT